MTKYFRLYRNIRGLLRYFILGTDTDCGKTYVTTQLIHYFKQQGKKVMALKPVATGSEINSDAMLLQAALCTKENICGWHLTQALSPHLAAAIDGVDLSIEAIGDFCSAAWLSQYDVLLIEGAGGLMVPLNAMHTWVDCLQKYKWPVILVVGMRLGCLNHALLTAAALQSAGIECVGWVANALDPQFMALEDNIKTLQTKLPWPMLAYISYKQPLKNV